MLLGIEQFGNCEKPVVKNRQRVDGHLPTSAAANIRDFVTLVTMIYDLFDDDPSFELVGVLRGTRRVCVTIQDCVMSTENLERGRM